jgi:hypothetical protein
MKELSTEIINIDGVDYTLFLNRKGITAWEKYTKSEREKVNELQQKYSNLLNGNEKDIDFDNLKDDANPFEGIEDVDDMDKDIEYMNKIYSRLYWIMFYTNHKLSISQSDELYKKACDEYGEEQVILLARQMLDDVNTDPNKNKELKNLTALKTTKN